MAQSLQSGAPLRKRAMFGLLDADGWGWASVKALIWFVVIILMLGYIPDRAYYLTVNRTLDLGLLAWSPVNLCPPTNLTLPCPAPVGAVVPWEPSPAELDLPAPRTDGAVAQLGTRLLYIGGSDGAVATTGVSIAMIKDGAFGAWSAGPALPEARSGASVAVVSGVLYLIGGHGPDGAPRDSVWSLTADVATGELGAWTPVENVTLPAARAGAAVLALSDGLIVAGGVDAAGAPAASVWKADISLEGLEAFEPMPDLLQPVAYASIAQVGDYAWLFGGSDANGPTGAVQRGTLGTGVEVAEGAIPKPGDPIPTLKLLQWGVSNGANLPVPRTHAAGFAANGTLYLVGGRDAAGPRGEVYWTVPTGEGNIDAWLHLDATDLPAAGLAGGSPIVVGSNAVVIGGSTAEAAAIASAVRANLAPEAPFFQLGLVGAVVPALRIEGEVGQQIGYLNAAGVGGLNFVILIAIGWAFNHRPQVAAWWGRRRGRRV